MSTTPATPWGGSLLRPDRAGSQPAARTADAVVSAGPPRMAAVLGVMCMVVLLCVAGVATARAAEGPGYGGTADELDVAWVDVQQPQAAGAGEGTIPASGSVPGLAVIGYGYRGQSEVDLQLGSASLSMSRVDATGTLDVVLDVPRSDQPQPGTSVLAAGRSPSGSAITLVGSVPPQSSGRGPMGWVPWIVPVLLAVLAARSVIRRLRA